MLPEKLSTNEEDFQKLRKKSKYAVELVNSIVYMSPATTPYHQKVQGKLNSEFIAFFNNSKYQSFQSINLKLYNENQDKIGDVIPDLSIFRNFSDYDSAFIKDIPEIIVEIVSPKSIYLDNIDKALLYKKSGVDEYWIVNIKNRTITIWDFKNNEQHIYFKQEVCSSTIYKDFCVNLEELFA